MNSQPAKPVDGYTIDYYRIVADVVLQYRAVCRVSPVDDARGVAALVARWEISVRVPGGQRWQRAGEWEGWDYTADLFTSRAAANGFYFSAVDAYSALGLRFSNLIEERRQEIIKLEWMREQALLAAHSAAAASIKGDRD